MRSVKCEVRSANAGMRSSVLECGDASPLLLRDPHFHRSKRSLRRGSWLEHGCESHPSNWVVHDGTRPQQRRREAGLEAEEDEQTGRNESEPQPMSLETSQTGDKPSLSLLGEGRWERVGQQPAPAQRSGGVRVDSTFGRQARVTREDSGDGR